VVRKFFGRTALFKHVHFYKMPVKKIFIYFSKKGLDFLWQVFKE